MTCCVIAKNDQELNGVPKLLTEQHNSIKFTIENEQNNKLLYSDKLVKKQTTETVTTV